MKEKKRAQKDVDKLGIDVEYTLDSNKCYFNRKGFAFYSKIHNEFVKQKSFVNIAWV